MIRHTEETRPCHPMRLRGCPVKLTGVGHYYPGDPIPNQFFEAQAALQIDDAWIRKFTGIESRHWADETRERHVEMGVKAATMALDNAQIKADAIDVIIGTTATARPGINPSSTENNYADIAPLIQYKIGAHRAFFFDVTAVACTGFLYASLLAQALLSNLHMQTALVVCTENPRPILNFNYRNSTLFGATAAAAVWQRTTVTSGLIDVVLHSDGQHFNAFDIDQDHKIMMRGKHVLEITPTCLIEVGREALARNGLTTDDIDWFIPHQANINIVHTVRDALEIPPERLLLNLTHRGNTSSASIPGCLSEYIQQGIVKPGELLLALSIGRGFSWGAMLFQYT